MNNDLHFVKPHSYFRKLYTLDETRYFDLVLELTLIEMEIFHASYAIYQMLYSSAGSAGKCNGIPRSSSTLFVASNYTSMLWQSIIPIRNRYQPTN